MLGIALSIMVLFESSGINNFVRVLHILFVFWRANTREGNGTRLLWYRTSRSPLWQAVVCAWLTPSASSIKNGEDGSDKKSTSWAGWALGAINIYFSRRSPRHAPPWTDNAYRLTYSGMVSHKPGEKHATDD